MKLSQRFTDTLRLTGLLAVLVTVGLLATACGEDNATGGATPLVRIWRVDQDKDVIGGIQETFLEENKVEFGYENKDLETYELDALKSLSARSGPDIWSIPDDWLGDHYKRLGYLPDTFFEAETKSMSGGPFKPSDFIKQIYPAGIAEMLVVPVIDRGDDDVIGDEIISYDRVYGLPTMVDTLRLYVNPELFETSRVEYIRGLGENATDEQIQPVEDLLRRSPTTWSEVVELTKYITKRDGNNISRSAIALGTADNAPFTADVLQLLIMQNGGKIVSNDRTDPLFHIPQTTATGVSVNPGQNALDFLASFSNPSKATYTWNPSMPQAVDAFGQGKVAMVIAFGDFGKELKIKYPKFEFELAPVPQISTAPLQEQVNLIRFWIETVPRVANNPTMALNFMKEMARNANTIAGEAGLASPFLKTLEAEPDNFPNKQILTGRAVFKKSRVAFDATFRQMIIDVSQNGLTAEQALKSGADKINIILDREDDI